MVDLETLGTGSNAAIVQLAAAHFDMATGAVGDVISVYVQPPASAAIDVSTVLWWLEQSSAARDGLVEGVRNGLPEIEALRLLSQLYRRKDVRRIWCQGLNFDLPLIADAYARHSLGNPLAYWKGRDTRTAYELAGYDYRSEPLLDGEVHHDALTDVKRQIRALRSALGQLGALSHLVA